MQETMKAFRVHDACDMRLEDLPIPKINDDEVLVRVKATGICTTDIELYDGSMPYYKQELSKRPLTIGHEWCGFVEKTGKNVTKVKKGDLVVGDISIGCGKCSKCLKGEYHLCDNRTELGVIRNDGSMAQYLKTDGKNVYKVPDGITPEEAALTEPTATSLYGVRKTGINPGDKVLVFGDGSIGMLTAQIANCSGASKVAIVARKNLHKEKINSWGIELINNKEGDLQENIEKVLGSKADVVFEATGNANVVADAVNSVKPGGKMCAMSITGAPTIPVDLDYIVTRDITVIGMLASPNSFAPALELISAGKIDVKSCISHKFKFEQTVEALDFVMQRKAADRIKVLIIQD